MRCLTQASSLLSTNTATQLWNNQQMCWRKRIESWIRTRNGIILLYTKEYREPKGSQLVFISCWCLPSPFKSSCIYSRAEKRTKTYTFNATAPYIPSSSRSHQELKEWGADVTEDEIFRMEDLEDFVGVDLQFIFALPTPVPTTAVPTKRVRTKSPSLEPEPKRRKFKVGSLVNMISKVSTFFKLFPMIT